MLALGSYGRSGVRGVLVRKQPTHPFCDVMIYLPVESIITHSVSQGALMKTSVRRGTHHQLCSLFTSRISQISKMVLSFNGLFQRSLIGLVLDRTGTLPDVHLIILQLTHVKGEGCRCVLHHQVLNIKGRSSVDAVIERDNSH